MKTYIFILLTFLSITAFGQIDPVEVGGSAHSGTADTPREAFQKLNSNDEYLDSLLTYGGVSLLSGTTTIRKFGSVPTLQIFRSGGTDESPSAIATGNSMQIRFGGYNGDAYSYGALINTFAEENWTSSAMGTSMSFTVKENGTVSDVTNFHILGTASNAGSVVIGPYGAANARLHVRKNNNYSTVDLFQVTSQLNNSYFKIDADGNAGIATASPNSTLQVSGSLSLSYVAKAANYTLTENDYVVEYTSGSFTATLPTAVGIVGRIYVIRNAGAGTITLATTSSQTIDGSSPGSLSAITGKITVMSNGLNWITL